MDDSIYHQVNLLNLQKLNDMFHLPIKMINISIEQIFHYKYLLEVYSLIYVSNYQLHLVDFLTVFIKKISDRFMEEFLTSYCW